MKTNKSVMNDMVVIRNPQPIKQVPQKEEVQKPIKKIQKENNSYLESQDKKNNTAPPATGGCALQFTSILCLIILLITLGGIMSSATITVTPKKYTDTLDLTATLSSVPRAGTLTYFTATKIFSQEKIVPITHTEPQKTFSEGIVRFYNSLAKPVSFPPKTLIKIISSEGSPLLYRTKKALIVPVAQGKKLGQKDVEIISINAGDTSNQPLTDFVLHEPHEGITIHSVTELTGGSDDNNGYADPSLITQAQDTVVQNFEDSSLSIQRMQEDFPTEMMSTGIVFADTQPSVHIENNHPDGIHVIAQKRITLVLVKKNQLASFLSEMFHQGEGEQLTIADPKTIHMTTQVLAAPQTLPENFLIRITGTTTLSGDIASDFIIEKTLGKSKSEAIEFLRNQKEIDKASISLTPFWRNVLPRDPKKITLTSVHE